MNSLRMSFWMVPWSWSWLTPCSSRRDDVAGEHRQHRAVHGHRDGHLLERDAVEEDLHVLDRVDRHAGLADVADHPRVVGVVAPVGGEVERHRQPHLPGGEVLAVEGVGLLGGGEPGVLADRPRTVRVHRGPGPPDERLEAGQGPDGLEALEVGLGVERLHRDPLGGRPDQGVGVALELLLGQAPPGVEGRGSRGSRRWWPRIEASSRPGAAPGPGRPRRHTRVQRSGRAGSADTRGRCGCGLPLLPDWGQAEPKVDPVGAVRLVEHSCTSPAADPCSRPAAARDARPCALDGTSAPAARLHRGAAGAPRRRRARRPGDGDHPRRPRRREVDGRPRGRVRDRGPSRGLRPLGARRDPRRRRPRARRRLARRPVARSSRRDGANVSEPVWVEDCGAGAGHRRERHRRRRARRGGHRRRWERAERVGRRARGSRCPTRPTGSATRWRSCSPGVVLGAVGLGWSPWRSRRQVALAGVMALVALTACVPPPPPSPNNTTPPQPAMTMHEPVGPRPPVEPVGGLRARARVHERRRTSWSCTTP